MRTIFFTSLFLFLSFLPAKSQVMFGKVDSKKILNFHSNYLTFSTPIELTVLGKKVKSIPSPLTLNGEKIYSGSSESLDAKAVFKKKDFAGYIFRSIKKELEKLPDGRYYLNSFNLVVDKNGKLAYFDFDTLKVTGENIKTFGGQMNIHAEDLQSMMQAILDTLALSAAPDTPHHDPYISEDIKTPIYFSLYKALKNCPEFRPAMRNKKPVNFLFHDPDHAFYFYVVKDHKAHLLKIK